MKPDHLCEYPRCRTEWVIRYRTKRICREHWRLLSQEATEGEILAALRMARDPATRQVGGQPGTCPICDAPGNPCPNCAGAMQDVAAHLDPCPDRQIAAGASHATQGTD